jgi:hypothetical protein
MLPEIHIAIPLLAEEENIRKVITLFDNARYQRKKLWLCVNQPDSWHNDETHASALGQNLRTLEFLNSLNRDDVIVIDRSSVGNGWTGKKHGVGMARKTLMDAVSGIAFEEDIIISMDADTSYESDYFAVIVSRLLEVKSALGIAVPYYHPLPNQESAARAILRYEVYMRYYALNMYQRELPYARTALGSAIALRVMAYKRVGGITPHQGGEDFYLLQKLAKAGMVLDYCDAVAFPSARLSSRVPIGTGPAMIRGIDGDWSGYPFYPAKLYDEVKTTFDAFPALYKEDFETPMSEFLRDVLREDDLWGPLRQNFKSENQFVRACKSRVDGLRIRQYLRYRYLQNPQDDLSVLNDFLRKKYATFVPDSGFGGTDIPKLNVIRDILFEDEQNARKNRDKKLFV